jgi:hypothetical protein
VHQRAELAVTEDRLRNAHDQLQTQGPRSAPPRAGDKECVLLDCIHTSEDEVNQA